MTEVDGRYDLREEPLSLEWDMYKYDITKALKHRQHMGTLTQQNMWGCMYVLTQSMVCLYYTYGTSVHDPSQHNTID